MDPARPRSGIPSNRSAASRRPPRANIIAFPGHAGRRRHGGPVTEQRRRGPRRVDDVDDDDGRVRRRRQHAPTRRAATAGRRHGGPSGRSAPVPTARRASPARAAPALLPPVARGRRTVPVAARRAPAAHRLPIARPRAAVAPSGARHRAPPARRAAALDQRPPGPAHRRSTAVSAGHAVHRRSASAAADHDAHRDAHHPRRRPGAGGPVADGGRRRAAQRGVAAVDARPDAGRPAGHDLRPQRRRAGTLGAGQHRRRQPPPGRGSGGHRRDVRPHPRARRGATDRARGGDGGQGPRLRLRRPPGRRRQGPSARRPRTGRGDDLPRGSPDPAWRRHGAQRDRAHGHRRERHGRPRAAVRPRAARRARRVDAGGGAWRTLDRRERGGDHRTGARATTSC